MRQKADTDGFDPIAEMVRDNFDQIPGSRTRASKDLPLTPAAISNILYARTKSWQQLKWLIQWFLAHNPGVGAWYEILSRLSVKFPEEQIWIALRNEDEPAGAVR